MDSVNFSVLEVALNTVSLSLLNLLYDFEMYFF